jgi:hypothetical protein
MKKNYTIAICDILGFTNLVQENPLDTVVQTYLGRLRKSLHHAIHQNKIPNEVPSLQALQAQDEVGLAWFSDTILIYTREDTDHNLMALLSCLSWLVFETIHTVGTRMRCGVSYGEAFIDPENSIYVGKPLIEAYRLEEEQAWTGGALTIAATQRLPKGAPAPWPQRGDWPLVLYEVPVKNNKTLKTFAIDWTIGIHRPLKLVWSDTHDEPPKADWAKSPDICTKWLNTKLFHDSVCRACKK